MKERIAEASPRFKARIASVFYLLSFLTGGVAVPSFRLVVSGDASATATKGRQFVAQSSVNLSTHTLLLNASDSDFIR